MLLGSLELFVGFCVCDKQVRLIRHCFDLCDDAFIAVVRHILSVYLQRPVEYFTK